MCFKKIIAYLLTDGRCTSDCWLFVRDMQSIHGVTLIGQPTHFMTFYTSANSIKLPSGKAIANIPMQAFIQLLNNFGEPFQPKYQYDGNMGDTKALEQWIIKINQDLDL